MILERKANFPNNIKIEPFDYSKFSICSECEEKYENYKYSGIMISLCKNCRYKKLSDILEV